MPLLPRGAAIVPREAARARALQGYEEKSVIVDGALGDVRFLL